MRNGAGRSRPGANCLLLVYRPIKVTLVSYFQLAYTSRTFLGSDGGVQGAVWNM